MVEKLATVASTLQCQLSWVWAHQVSASLDLSLKVFPGGGEQREEVGQLNEWHHPIGYCPRLNKKGNSKDPSEHP